ncbi:MAG TPA: peroxiredoxin-like family protein [Hyphomicrobiales bacterium]|nr:peroxiredoxin-like family protein [Hyphomicrobiales bacterium]
MLIPRAKTPPLKVDTLSHGRFSLPEDGADRFTLVTFYRGLHCPICGNYLRELERLTPEFEERGVKTIAISSDGQDRAKQMADKIEAAKLRIGYALSLSVAKDWGLYISTSRGKTSIGIEEPPLFSEPGLFLVRPDQTLYYASVQTMPFVRPAFKELVQALDFAIANNYPARGEYTGAV